MKKIIILEGIATSGKTSLKNFLTEYFHREKIGYLAIGEETTLMPILENKEKSVSLNFLKRLISDAFTNMADFIIFDRLFFTHILTTNSDLTNFSEIENLLAKHDTLLVLLTMKEQEISKRIFEAMNHRGESWSTFVRRKGTDHEIIKYYTNQQKALVELTNKLKLDSIILDTTDMDFDILAKKIINIKMTTV